MKILVVCQYYYPEPFKVTEVCEALVEDGYEVTVLTGLPNYPEGVVPEEYKSVVHNDEIINGVRVLRCYERGRRKGAFNLAVNYATFYFAAMSYIKKLSFDYDIVFSYQLSPIFMALPARWYKIHRYVPMFLYCCDLWPESLKIYIKNEDSPIFKWVKKVSRKVYDSCDLIATQSDVFVDYLKEVHDVPDEKVSYIPNFASEDYLLGDFSKEPGKNLDIVFTGNVGIAQNLEDIIDGFALACEISDNHSINDSINHNNDNSHDITEGNNINETNARPGSNNAASNIKLHIVGSGVRLDAIKEKVKALGLDENVIFYGQRPKEEMPEFYKMADACLVSLKSDSVIGLTLPAKVQEYMAAGKPVIGMINGSCQKIIKEADCGFCVDAGDIEGFSRALRVFAISRDKYPKYGENSRKYFTEHFRKETHIQAIEEQIENATKSSIYIANML